MTTQTINSAIETWDAALGLPRYTDIADADYEPAILAGFETDKAAHEEIANSSDAPTFENTIEAMERIDTVLGKAASLFFTKAANHTNEDIQAVERKLSPLFARHSAEIASNATLFQRIDTLWQSRNELGLNAEQHEVLRRYHRMFTRMGAGLTGEPQKRLFSINERLATLGTQFGQNVLKDEAEWIMVLDSDDDLAGLPKSLVQAMAGAAAERGHEGKHAVTLARSIVEPFLTFSARRDLREKAFDAWTKRGANGGETDNSAIIAETLKLRAERASLLGFDTFAEFKLDGTMAKKPEAVNELLSTVWEKATARAHEEAADIEELMRSEGDNGDLTAADWRYYAEKIRAERFAFSDDDVKPHMRLNAMIDASFDVAGKLFGLSFEEVPDAPWLHPDARVWQVFDADEKLKALFIGDYFARPSKRSGAWMSAIQGQSHLKGKIPFITNTMNFAKPPEGEEAFLSFDDARTLFHEFGHALHGMLSDVTYPSVAGTSVSRDFVELPSQLYEHWLTVPDVLNAFALHAETGEPMPKELVDKVLAAQTFNAGFQTVEYTACAMVDMAYHQRADAPDDAIAFQNDFLTGMNKPKAVAMRHASPHFLHIFAGDGYAAGYYAYMWSEVLDADAFRAFEEAGNPFHPEIAKKLKDHIYSVGGSVEPEDAYIAFRGKLPTPDAMLEGRGLA
ncbi:MAG: M3 family metallopeptidase [Pseudomonadota bacterium]